MKLTTNQFQPCQHPSHEIRLRTLSNQSTAVHKQCLACGESLAGAISKSKFTPEQLAALPPYNDTLRQEYWDKKSAERKAAVDEELKALKVFNQAEYEEYLRSPEWRDKRDIVMKRDNYVCQGCLNARATDIHHKTYSHLYRELLFQLISVCRKCHKILHNREDEQ